MHLNAMKLIIILLSNLFDWTSLHLRVSVTNCSLKNHTQLVQRPIISLVGIVLFLVETLKICNNQSIQLKQVSSLSCQLSGPYSGILLWKHNTWIWFWTCDLWMEWLALFFSTRRTSKGEPSCPDGTSWRILWFSLLTIKDIGNI